MKNTHIADVVKVMDIGLIKPYPGNPRRNAHAVKPVMASIRQFGFKVPIIIDKEHTIIAGHTRLEAAKELGMSEVPVIVADDLTPEQVKAFRLADNKTAELSGWDFDLLDIELADITDIDMSELGFDIDPKPDIDGLFLERDGTAEAGASGGSIHVVSCPHCGASIELDDEFNALRREDEAQDR
ncbi:MAG: ParB N-terminal domain-containing protein [Synergistaceae bacterium]|nr:ParB N-terminal domain-containing protein [Synergistaceae bacterium]